MSGNGFALCGREAGTVEGSDCEILFILLSSQVHTGLRGWRLGQDHTVKDSTSDPPSHSIVGPLKDHQAESKQRFHHDRGTRNRNLN